jgi:uncharacterized membrane protein
MQPDRRSAGLRSWYGDVHDGDAAIGMPLLIKQYGGDPAIVCAIGMLAGFCGTLMTPMAANFNLVPAALLELKDKNGVIKAQIGTALPLLAVNIALIYLLAFR